MLNINATVFAELFHLLDLGMFDIFFNDSPLKFRLTLYWNATVNRAIGNQQYLQLPQCQKLGTCSFTLSY
jgi:hypothetical protein